MSGKPDKRDAEVTLVTHAGLLLTVEGRGYFAAFVLAALPAGQVFDVEYCGHGHIWWDAADIDLHTDILAAPDAFPISFQGSTRVAASLIGRVGGSAKTKRKTLASRENGKKGGRPKTQSALV